MSEQEINPLKPDTQPLVAFGRFLKTEMYDVFGDYDLSALSDREKAWISPEKFQSILFEVPSRKPYAVDGVALNASEYQLVLRTSRPEHLAQTAFVGTVKDKDITDEVLAAGQRAPQHSLESKFMEMSTHRNGMIERRSQILELEREASMPGFAHKREDVMKLMLGEAWLELTGMLDAIHLQRNWDDNKRIHAEAALIHYLTQGSQRTRVSHWKEMLSLGERYLRVRINLFKNRMDAIDRIRESQD